ncbi:MAG TPA: hypothetical protein VNB64_03485, partial [Solirubrobacteraceae bacterium]|nr:hypothetical protein [Solirubrobacteraceae bacterium]
RRAAFERLGGFAPGAGANADWELLARAARAGMVIEVYPDAVSERTAPAGFVADALDPEVQGTTGLGATDPIAPYREDLDGPQRELPAIARTLFWTPYGPLRDEVRLRTENDELRREVHDLRIWKAVYERSVSWRLTRPVRRAGRMARAVRARVRPKS